MRGELRLTWLGTAGFLIEAAGESLLLDPVLGGAGAPGLDRLARARAVFISHGHFDHVMDLPALLADSQAQVYGNKVTIRCLAARGVPPERMTAVEGREEEFRLGGLAARAFAGAHVRFDLPLVFATLRRSWGGFRKIWPLLRDYPCGRVLCWRFEWEGRSLLHLGSAGRRPGQVAAMARRPPEILLAPLQGHSRITDKALELTRELGPRVVLPHHFDDFYPPVSQWVDPEPFRRAVAREMPDCRVLAPRLGETIVL